MLAPQRLNTTTMHYVHPNNNYTNSSQYTFYYCMWLLKDRYTHHHHFYPCTTTFPHILSKSQALSPPLTTSLYVHYRGTNPTRTCISIPVQSHPRTYHAMFTSQVITSPLQHTLDQLPPPNHALTVLNHDYMKQ